MSPATSRSTGRRLAVVLAILLLLATLPGLAAAEQRTGGTVVVPAGETVTGGLTAYGGTVVVRGTVQGDVHAFAGDVRIDGRVTGNVQAYAGSVIVSGNVGGNVEATAGTVSITPNGSVGGDLSVAGGDVLVAGTVHGNAALTGGSITLAGTARIDGDVRYAVGTDGQFVNNGATIGGSVVKTEGLQAGPIRGPQFSGWIFGIYGFLANLLLGVILLLGAPGLSRTVVDRIVSRPVHTGGVGVLAAIGIPVVLLILAISIIGLPLALLGLFGYLAALWGGLVYGRYAIGAWVLSRGRVENRWAGLVVGLVVLGIAGRLPAVGWLVNLVVILLGLGAMVAIGYERVRSES